MSYKNSAVLENSNENQLEPRASVANYVMSTTAFQWKNHYEGLRYDFGDDQAGSFPLPFSFNYYGQNYNTVYFSSNGYLSFYNTNPTTYSNPPFPSDSSNARRVIAPFWDDLTGSNSGGIFTNNGSGYVSISWIDYYRLSGQIVGTFQVVLFQDGKIQINYQYISYVGGGYTAGLNYGDGYYYNNYAQITDSTNNLGLLFTPGVDSDTILSQPADPTFEANSGSHIITWTATDSTLGSNPTYEIYSNGVPIISNMPWSSGVPINLDVSSWNHGVYNILIYVYDGFGGEVHDAVSLLITPAGGNLAPIFTTRPNDFDFSTNDPNFYSIDWQVYDPNVSGTQYYDILYLYTWGGQYLISNHVYWESGDLISIPISWYGADHYFLRINVYDGFGLMVSDEVEVLCFNQGNINPNINHPEDITYVVGDPAPPPIIWTINDDYYTQNRYYQVFRDDSLFMTNSWNDGTVVNINPVGLSLGTHTYEIFIDDAQEGTASDTVIVQVVANVAPVISDLPDLQYSVYSPVPTILTWFITDDTIIGDPDYTIRVDGSIVATGNWDADTPISFPWDNPTSGVYTVYLEIDDNAGGTDFDTVVVTVNNAPYISSPANIQYILDSDQSYTIRWHVIDLTIGDSSYSITRDGVEIAQGIWISGDDLGNIDVSGLNIGTYVFEIIVFDGTGFNATDIVIVTVLASIEDETEPASLAWYWIVLIVGGVGVATFVLINVVKKKKFGYK